MSKQKGIMSFFKPVATKRLAPDNVESKKMKLENENESASNKENSGDALTNPCQDKISNISKEFEIIDKDMGQSWFSALESEFSKPYFKKLNDFVFKERQSFTVYPTVENVWSWTKFCPLRDVKVVIIGQDPYHNPRQAHGLCFSVMKGVSPPPSLLNIYKELTTDIPGFVAPKHGDLTSWAKQGVLLLNACLTVREHQPNSHADKGWEKITDAAIKAVSDKNSGVVFLLWGAFAQKKASIVNKTKHHLLKAPHPSPLSASRGFLGCKHFSQCNKLLSDANKQPIEWNLN